MSKKYYYNVWDDIDDYPDCWCYISYSGRNTGKTYSSLLGAYRRNLSFAFTKRTNKDVDILCNASKKVGAAYINMSPWKKIMKNNPDIHVKEVKYMEGIGGFHNASVEGEAMGEAFGYIFSLNAIGDIKGFEAEVDYLMFDEFIPKPWERVNRKEGDQFLDLYKTLDRDRIHRGIPPVKCILTANATEINNPMFNTLGLVDVVAEYDHLDEFVLIHNGMCIRKVLNNEEFVEKEKEHPLYKSLKDTEWGIMAFDGSFAYNDFSKVDTKVSLKHSVPVLSFTYKGKDNYIYQRNGKYYVTFSKFNQQGLPHYDLKQETEQKRFWGDWIIDLRAACIEGNMLFKAYSQYNLILNYKDVFKI